MNATLPTSAPFRDPLRPPTPPKEHMSDPSSGIKPDHIVPSRSTPYTPDESPSSSAELSDALSVAARKRVKISGNTLYHHLPSSSAKGYESDELRILPRSRDCKSTKSILKPKPDRTAVESGNEQLLLNDSSLQAMLKSANGHLSNDSRSSSLDAYSILSASLSTFDTPLKSDQLVSQVEEMAQYLKRDILRRPPADAETGSQLIAPALRIVILFLASSECSGCLPDDFRLFLADQAILGLENAETPKVILAQYMHVLEKQKFGPKVMTVDRIQRLLSALDKLDKHARSPRIAAHRLMIYKRLLGQARSIMVSKVLTWLRHLIGGLLSSVKDIRLRAISFGLEAGIQVGSAGNVSRACMDVLEQKNREDQTLVKKIYDRSVQMVISKEDPDQVPQIWSILILLLRHHRSKIESWNHFGFWKEVVQLCLEAPHIQTQHQAHLAVNRLIYVINVDTMSNSLAKFLKEVMASRLTHVPHQKSGEKKMSISKQSARSTYCTLLYASLHPAASHAHLDYYWDLYVDGILSSCLSTNKRDTLFACEVLSALLFYQGPPRIWNERHAITTGPVLPTELLNIDPRWVRSRAIKITSSLRRFSSMNAWFEDGERVATLFRLWQNFIMAIGSASSKEVRVSNETVVALSSLMNQFKTLTDYHRSGQGKLDELLEVLKFFLDEMVSKIGALALNEKRLALTAEKSFEAISDTPSSRLKVKSTAVDSLGFHLMRLILNVKVEGNTLKLMELHGKIVAFTLQTVHSRPARLTALRGISHRFLHEAYNHATEHAPIIWSVLAESCLTILRSHLTIAIANESPYSGQELFDAVKVLDCGVPYLALHSMAVWQSSIEGITNITTRDIGSIGNVVLLEPLFNALCRVTSQQEAQTSVSAATSLLDKISWPQSSQSFDRSRAKVFGTNREIKPFPAVGLPEGCFALVNLSLDKAYSNSSSVNPGAIWSLLAAVISLINKCPSHWRVLALGKLQAKLAIWFEDSEGSLQDPKFDEVSQEVGHLWTSVVAIINAASSTSSDLLSQVHLLLTAGLRSRRKSIVNDAILVWNRTFGGIEDLECTHDLRSALQKVSSLAEIDMNGLDYVPSQHDQTIFAFVDSQNAEPHVSASHQATENLKMSPTLRYYNNSLAKPKSNAGSITSSKEIKNAPRPRRISKITPRAKLRHDNSQIQFAPIDSSPFAEDECTLAPLTKRQQEVRDRQIGEAALFPQLQPSHDDRPLQKDPKLPAFNLKSRGRRVSISQIADGSSPILSPLEISDGVLGSSPTPSSSRHRSEERSLDEELPSSPLVIASQLSENHSAVPDALEVNVFQDQPVTVAEVEVQHFSSKKSKTPESIEPRPHGIGSSATDVDIQSNLDVFVDAPSEPLGHSKSSARPSFSEASRDGKLFSGPLQTSKPNERINQSSSSPNTGGACRVGQTILFTTEAQVGLISPQKNAEVEAELQRALEVPTAKANSSKNKRKRKLNTDNLEQDIVPRDHKRRAVPTIQNVKEHNNTSTREIVADCVLIDSRPLEGVFQSVSPEKEATIKQERADSPGLAEIASILHASSAPRPRSSGQAESDAKRRKSSQEASLVRRSGRQVCIKQESTGDEGRIVKPRRRQSRRSSNASEPLALATSAPLDDVDSPMVVPEDLETSPSSVPGGVSEEDGHQTHRSNHASQGKDIISSFKGLLNRLRGVTLETEEKDELMEILLRSGLEAQAAARRSIEL